MPSTLVRITAALAALAAAVSLSACSDPSQQDRGSAQPTTQAPIISGQPAAHNAVDIAFAQNMIPHHRQAIEMSALVPDRSTNPQIIKLASQISAAQDPEVRTLNTFLVQWNQDAATPDRSGPAQMPMDGMAKLASLQGAEFDRLWLQSMIGHHQGAIEMAKAEIANGANIDAIAMAKNIAATQQTEIDQMKTMVGG